MENIGCLTVDIDDDSFEIGTWIFVAIRLQDAYDRWRYWI